MIFRTFGADQIGQKKATPLKHKGLREIETVAGKDFLFWKPPSAAG
jgi:hypothetical protein